jgi:hypothetical protein
MNIENYVCTLEQANKLKNLGVERESIFAWILGTSEFDDETCVGKLILREDIDRATLYMSGYLCAYTSQEVGEEIVKILPHWRQNESGNTFYFYPLPNPEIGEIFKMGWRLPEAQARTEFLIHLLKEKA